MRLGCLALVLATVACTGAEDAPGLGAGKADEALPEAGLRFQQGWSSEGQMLFGQPFNVDVDVTALRRLPSGLRVSWQVDVGDLPLVGTAALRSKIGEPGIMRASFVPLLPGAYRFWVDSEEGPIDEDLLIEGEPFSAPSRDFPFVWHAFIDFGAQLTIGEERVEPMAVRGGELLHVRIERDTECAHEGAWATVRLYTDVAHEVAWDGVAGGCFLYNEHVLRRDEEGVYEGTIGIPVGASQVSLLVVQHSYPGDSDAACWDPLERVDNDPDNPDDDAAAAVCVTSDCSSLFDCFGGF